ncbi:uncharacterized protein LOC111332205 [Stylophora pistillata]|uniref:uncharacterized protein LOC111332205 n=1 Tax=Stylophora pistillata TaxID=50429 RepID=UPI000C050FE6|nr:uncharacterized protein LOC111332205 [Stylophora pistillata]
MVPSYLLRSRDCSLRPGEANVLCSGVVMTLCQEFWSNNQMLSMMLYPLTVEEFEDELQQTLNQDRLHKNKLLFLMMDCTFQLWREDLRSQYTMGAHLWVYLT